MKRALGLPYNVPQILLPIITAEFPLATSAIYFRVQLDNEVGNEVPLSIAEFQVWAEDNGKARQEITFPNIDRKRSTDPAFELEAISSAGLEVAYEILSGPATVNGNILSLTGEGGIVEIRATQAGDDNTNPAAPRQQSFEVIDPQSAGVASRIVSLTESYQLVMPELKPYKLKAMASIDFPDLFDVNGYFEINGFVVETRIEKGLFTAWWRPYDYGVHQVSFVAMGSNGKTERHDFLHTMICLS